MVTDIFTDLVDMFPPILPDKDIYKILKTFIGPLHFSNSLTHINCYMDEIIMDVQVGTKFQHQVFDGTL